MADATSVTTALEAVEDPADVPAVARFYAGTTPGNVVMGVPIPKVFPIAKAHAGLPLDQIEVLLDDPRYQVRMAAVAIMDFQAQRKSLSAEHRKALFDLYLRRHDRIDTWDLVDRAARRVVGEYLLDKDRSVLGDLARSEDPWRRRTAIVATFAFIRLGETRDILRIAGILSGDPHEYVQKALGSWLREAGKVDEDALVAFLQAHRDTLPKTTMTSATAKLSPARRERLRKLA
jgi:hypothetical protein